MLPSFHFRSATRAALLALFLLVIPAALFGQTAAAPPTGCAAMLERWKGIAVVPLPEWRVRPFESVRGAAPEQDDSAWESVKMWAWPKEAGTSWFRRWVEVPASSGGYDLRNSPPRFGACTQISTVVLLGSSAGLTRVMAPSIFLSHPATSSMAFGRRSRSKNVACCGSLSGQCESQFPRREIITAPAEARSAT